MLDTPRPPLWFTRSAAQVYFTTLITTRLGAGPGLLACADVPDFNHFNNRACQIVPLYRDADASEPNVATGLLAELSDRYGCAVSAEDLAAYCYALMAHPGYEERFRANIASPAPSGATPGPRIPLTADADLFKRACSEGRRMLWLHTAAERFTSRDEARPADVPRGTVRNTLPVPDLPQEFAYDPEARALNIGTGQFAPVDPEVYEYTVSGHQVIPYWLSSRLRPGAGRQDSELDLVRPDGWTAADTTELLTVLRILEASVEHHPVLSDLLDEVLASDLWAGTELPAPTREDRAAPLPPDEDSQHALDFES